MAKPQVHERKRFYLSGGMEYALDEGRNWRGALQQWLERELAAEVFNPNHESDAFFRRHHPGIDFRKLKMEDPEHYKTIASRLVDIDCREIAERSDAVICYWDESAMRGAGTKGELTMARFARKPVYLVTTMPRHEIPGWVLGCITTIFGSFDDLKQHLLGG